MRKQMAARDADGKGLTISNAVLSMFALHFGGLS